VPIFGDEPDPADIEFEYIQRVVPNEAADLWNRSIEESPSWDSYSPEDHMFLADMFASALYAGDLDSAEDWTEYLDIDWDHADIHEFYEAYGALTGN
jgi:hypothetical protein